MPLNELTKLNFINIGYTHCFSTSVTWLKTRDPLSVTQPKVDGLVLFLSKFFIYLLAILFDGLCKKMGDACSTLYPSRILK